MELALGSPLAWGLAFVSLLVLLVLWARTGWRVRGPAAPIVVAAIATYLPWLALQGDRSQVFLWYILPTIPFLYAAAGVVVAWSWRWLTARVLAAACGVAVIGLFAFFLPVLAALPLDADGWRLRMWATDCARPGAPTLTLPDDEISSGPPPSGWCWI